MREFEPSGARTRRRFDDDEPHTLKTRRRPNGAAAAAAPFELADPDELETNWTTWDAPDVQHGPKPRPDWVVTELAAVDTELGVLKTGKEAEVHLVEREVPGTDRSCLLAAKRYRASEHRLFHRDAGYLEGRRTRESRMTRAMANRTAFGRDLIAGQWAGAEFAALTSLWRAAGDLGCVSVPYPVQLLGTELMMEFIGEADGTAAPRLAQLRPVGDQLVDLWEQLVAAMRVLAHTGYAHGDLSPYNLLVHRDRLVMIDLPQVVDVVGNPQGRQFLARDVRVVTTWFAARGLPAELVDPDLLLDDLLARAGMR